MFSRQNFRANLLLSVSLGTMLIGAGEAEAQDALRRRAPDPAAQAASAAAANARGLASAATAAQRTMQAFERAAAKRAQMDALQVAARQAARAASVSVTNGLGAGGLEVAAGANLDPDLWIGADAPTQQDRAGRVEVTINQTSGQAILTWDRFDVGRETDLIFQQPDSTSLALNRVTDAYADPSRILGSIRAPGQVMVINRNGVIFGGASQVNVRTLIASTLPINGPLLDQGILYGNPDLKFTFSAYGEAADGGLIVPAATARTQTAQVEVQAGAQITTSTTANHNGGRVVLLAPEVINAGSISTPDGQTLLVAGQQVILRAHPSDDPSVRGLDAYVGAVFAPVAGLDNPLTTSLTSISNIATGVVTNTGTILAERGAVTMVGADVRQMGAALATSSVALNGRVDLQAVYGGKARGTIAEIDLNSGGRAGLVTLGEGSLTQILPEYGSQERTVGARLALTSQVEALGQSIYLGENAHVLAPSGTVSLIAGKVAGFLKGGSPRPNFRFADEGQIYMDAGASINVAGSIANASVSSNIVDVELRGAQLADSPLQRDSALRGKTVQVDIRQSGVRADGTTWVGTPLADASGFVNLIQRSVGELTTNGGSVVLNAADSIALQAGSTIDASNGWINYEAGFVRTSQLTGADGRRYDISKATPDLVYTGFAGEFDVTHQRWDITEEFLNPVIARRSYQSSYIHGADGGSVSISAPVVALSADLTGEVVTGERQRSVAPTPSVFSLITGAPNAAVLPPADGAVPQSFIFQSNVTPAFLRAFDPDASSTDLAITNFLSPALLGPTGFGNIAVTANGDIRVLTALDGTPRGAFSLAGRAIDIDADVILPGGALTLSAGGALTIADNVTLSTAGLLVDDRRGTGAGAIAVKGGSMSLAGAIDLDAGTVLDVSGGAYINARGAITAGEGGALSIFSGLLPDAISIDGTLRGYGLRKGGSLSFNAGTLQIGGTSSNPDVSVLSSNVFNQGGFRSFSLMGEVGLLVTEQTQIAPVIQNYALSETADGMALAPIVLESASRSPATISLLSGGNPDFGTRSYIKIEEGTSIFLAPTLTGQGSINISPNYGAVTMLGSISAPGGAISIRGSLRFGEGDSLILGSNSVLSAAGATVLSPNTQGLRIGDVLDGGKITLSGAIVAPAGALIDVSGTSDVFDIAALAPRLGPAYTSTRLDSDGGSVRIGSEVKTFEATLRGGGGGVGGAGGDLAVTVASIAQTLEQVESGAAQFAVESFENSGFDALSLGGDLHAIGPVRIAADRSIVVGTGALSADDVVDLEAPYVAIGSSYAPAVLDPITKLPVANATTTTIPGIGSALVDPTTGPGALQVSAQLIDVGNLALRGIGQASLNAPGGDIRGYGTLAVRGDLSLTAGQIYPAAATVFTLAAFTHANGGGQISVSGGDAVRGLPFSAGGTLNLFADRIRQDGVLRAPFGVINLGSTTAQKGYAFEVGNPPANLEQIFETTTSLSLGSGSITSVSGIDPVSGLALTLPFGTAPNGTSWFDPWGNDILARGAPVRAINLLGKDVVIGEGSTLDLRGGGDLFAYNWVKGLGGSRDILGSSSSFAVLPGFTDVSAPLVTLVGEGATSQDGWRNGALAVGDRIWLEASAGLPAGYYTLLPARFALVPGAFLVTPNSGAAREGVSFARPDGSSLVTGHLGNTLTGIDDQSPGLFEVAPQVVVSARAQYDLYFANDTLREGALAKDQAVPRLPIDAGQLLLSATRSLDIAGRTLVNAPAGGRGGLVDISSPRDFVINSTGRGSAPDTLYLNATNLSAFGAESLLVGGVRRAGGNGAVDVATASVTVANDAASALVGPEIILASKDRVVLQEGATITQAGSLSGPGQALVFGDAATPRSGDGALLRVSSDTSSSVTRLGVGGLKGDVTVGAGVRVSGESIILDSTRSTNFDASARILGTALTLGSGQISLQLTDPGALQPNTGLVLSTGVLGDIQSRIGALSLLSYSTIDFYGAGAVGGVDGAGQPITDSLTLHAAGIRGFNAGGGEVVLNAKHVLLDNSVRGAPAKAVTGVNSAPNGSLVVNAETVEIGANAFNVVGYADVDLRAPAGVLMRGEGSFSTKGDLSVTTSLIAGADGARHALLADGALRIDGAVQTPSVTGGLGADVTLRGTSVDIGGAVRLASGALSARATQGDLRVAGSLDVSGAAQTFFDQVRYTDGGRITLSADKGAIALASSSVVNVGAKAGGGDAGALAVTAINGTFDAAGALVGAGGANGADGRFALDVGAQSSVGALNATLNAGGFDTRDVRVRHGDVLVDGVAQAQHFKLAADDGAIRVTGAIDASGVTGGEIDLHAYRGVTVASGAVLSVAAEERDAAGKGGVVNIESGQAKQVGPRMVAGNGWIDLQAGSLVDLSVAGGPGGVLHLRAPQITGVDANGTPVPTLSDSVAGGNDVAIRPLNGEIRNASSVVVEGVQVFDLSNTGAITTAVQANVAANAQNFTANTTTIANRLVNGTVNAGLGAQLHIRPGEELVTRASLPVTLSTAGGAINLPAEAALTFPSGVPVGDTIMFSVSGVHIAADGSRQTFAANTPVTVAAGGTVILDAAGTLTFVSGTSPIAVTLEGAITSVIGGASSLNVSGNGVGISVGAASTVNLPASSLVTFAADMTLGDSLVTLPAGTLTVPPGANAILQYQPATTGLVLSGAVITLAPGAQIVQTGPSGLATLRTLTAGATVDLRNNQTIAFGGNSAVATTEFPLRAGTNTGSTFTGDSFSLNSGLATITFLPTAAGRIVNASTGATLKTFSPGVGFANEPGFANARFVLDTPGRISVTTPVLGNTGSQVQLTYRSSIATNAMTLALPAGVYGFFNGTITALPADSQVSGTYSVQSGPIYQTVSSSAADFVGRTVVWTTGGNLLAGLSTGVAFTKSTAAGSLSTSATSAAVPLTLEAPTTGVRTFATTGSVSVTPSARDLTLASPGWDLSTQRFGPSVNPSITGSGEPGILTLRSGANLVFTGSLSDGFISANSGVLLPAGVSSWSYRLVAGADLTGADFEQVLPMDRVPAAQGSVRLGVSNSLTTAADTPAGFDQRIRTGTGDIDITAARDVQFLSPTATIYTAGSQYTPGGASASTLNPGGTLSLGANVPLLFPSGTASSSISASTAGVVTIIDPATGLTLPAGTVYSFANGFGTAALVDNNNNNVPANFIRINALQAELTAPDLGSIASVPGLSTISGFSAGDTVYLGGAISASSLTSSGPGVVYVRTSSNQYTATPFEAGPVPAAAVVFGGLGLAGAGNYIVLKEGGSISSGAGAVNLMLPKGVFTLTTTDVARQFSISRLPEGADLRLRDPVGGNLLYDTNILNASPVNGRRVLPRFVARVPLTANMAMALPAKSTVTLESGGVLSLAGAASAPIRLPVPDVSDNTYLFDTPILSNGVAGYLGNEGRRHVGSRQPLSTGSTVSIPFTAPQYSTQGGDVSIQAGRDILTRKTNFNGAGRTEDSSQQLPVNWLYRRSSAADGAFTRNYFGDMASTTWWVDFNNFYEGVGALGGGNVTLNAGRDVLNVDAHAPTNAWMPYASIGADGALDRSAANQPLFESGGGDLTVNAGRNIDGGVYYVERGEGALSAGGVIKTNSTRIATTGATGSDPSLTTSPDFMATTLFLGKGSFDVSARGDVLLGSVANPFLLPQGILNSTWARSYFSTYAPDSGVSVDSLAGDVTLQDSAGRGSLGTWFRNVLAISSNASTGSVLFSPASNKRWLALGEANSPPAFASGLAGGVLPILSSTTRSSPIDLLYSANLALMPSRLAVTAFSGDVNVNGEFNLAPSATGGLSVLAGGEIDGFSPVYNDFSIVPTIGSYEIGQINISDASPSVIPSVNAPLPLVYDATKPISVFDKTVVSPTASLNEFKKYFEETGSASESRIVGERLHDSALLHLNDPEPVRLYAASGNISGLLVYAPKSIDVIAGNDITDVAFFAQNLSADDISRVIAGRDIIPYNPKSAARLASGVSSTLSGQTAASGDISIGGPGTLQVLAGRNLDLGGVTAPGSNQIRDTTLGLGIVSIGNARNPFLPFDQGSQIVAAAGLGAGTGVGLSGRNLDVSAFVARFLDPATAGEQAARYLPELGARLGMNGAGNDAIYQAFKARPVEQQELDALAIFYLVLRDAGRDRNDGDAPDDQRNYELGYAAIAALLPGDEFKGNVSLTSREIKTASGGDISILAPGGAVFVGVDLGDKNPLDQGILTLGGGNISIYTKGDVAVGTSRIFTFTGGNEIIWSSEGNIAAGSASKTVQSAPPARFLVDPQTGASVLDLAGLATGGGIGVLQTEVDAPPSDVDLIAPSGFVDAGDAGIRVSGNFNVAALQVLNADNIQVGGKSAGLPVITAVDTGALSSASAAAAVGDASGEIGRQLAPERRATPSIVNGQFLGFGVLPECPPGVSPEEVGTCAAPN